MQVPITFTSQRCLWRRSGVFSSTSEKYDAPRTMEEFVKVRQYTVRSVHIYKKESYLHTIQQEFQAKAGILKEICPALHYVCICEDATLVKEYMKLVTAKQRRTYWQCLLDFCTTPPRISHSSVTENELVVANAWSIANALIINANNAQESCDVNWECSPFILPSISACLKEYESFEHIVGNHISKELTDAATQRIRLDLWQQWGSDLELASPRLSIDFELTLPRNHNNNESNSVYGDMPSPLSSSLSSNNVGSFPWTMQSSLTQSPKMASTVTGTQLDESLGVNVIQVACMHISRESSYETQLGESSNSCNILATNDLPLDLNQMASVNAVDLPGGNNLNGFHEHLNDCGSSQLMSAASNTYSSGDEMGFEAETLDGLKGVKLFGVKTAKSNRKLHKSGNSKAGSRRLLKLTKAELTHYFNMPITQASKELNVGLTVLKKRCRIFGIPRWPHRKMKSINGLIQNIQDLVKTDISGENVKDSKQVQVAVKELEKQKMEMQECPSIQLPEKTKRLRQACFKASYRKRRQANHDHGAHNHHEHQNAPAYVNYNDGTMLFYQNCD